MTRAAKPATVRFYFDADVLGLAKALVNLRPDITYPGDPGGVVHRRLRAPCPITSPATLDTVWIPEVARRGWIIVTRDSRIREHRAELAAVRENGARLVALAGRDARSTWEQLEILMIQWRTIESKTDQPGPFVFSATRTRFREELL